MLSGPHDSTALTWADLKRLMHQTISRITASCDQIKTGDSVATWLPNGLAWILVDLASQWMGWVHVAVDSRLPAAKAFELVQHSCARLIVTETSQTARFAHMPTVTADELEGIDRQRFEGGDFVSPELDVDAPAQLLYTSGTVLQPKGALLSHRNLLSNAYAKLDAAPQFPTDVRLNILPLAHAYARTCELSTWILSGSELCVATDWDTFLQWAPKLEPTLINLVPHLVYRLMERLESGGDEISDASADAQKLLGSRLRLLQVGGAALREDVWHRLAALGWPPLQGYGLTETSPVVCSNRAGQQRHDTVGPPVAGVEVHIDNDGVLWTRGPHVMLGYWQNAAATREKLCDGWFCTGDLAERLADGSLRIIGRLDDQITLSTGYKVAPLEMTNRLANDPWIEHLVLVGQDRPFIAALVYPRLAKLPVSVFNDPGRLSLDPPALAKALVERLSPLTRDLPRSMQIERIGVMQQPLTTENGGLNFKGAIRRRFVESVLCRVEVERIYQD